MRARNIQCYFLSHVENEIFCVDTHHTWWKMVRAAKVTKTNPLADRIPSTNRNSFTCKIGIKQCFETYPTKISQMRSCSLFSAHFFDSRSPLDFNVVRQTATTLQSKQKKIDAENRLRQMYWPELISSTLFISFSYRFYAFQNKFSTIRK